MLLVVSKGFCVEVQLRDSKKESEQPIACVGNRKLGAGFTTIRQAQTARFYSPQTAVTLGGAYRIVLKSLMLALTSCLRISADSAGPLTHLLARPIFRLRAALGFRTRGIL